MVRPSGTVTFLFTDIEGSTRRWEVDPDAMRTALATHDEVLRAAIGAHDGWLFKHTGDGVCAAFSSARGAIDAAIDAQRLLTLPVRMGIATGEVQQRDGDYFGPALNRAARVMGVGHGGQVLVAASSAGLVSHDGLVDLGECRLRDLSGAERLYQIHAEGLRVEFPPLRTLDAVPGNLPVYATTFVGRDVETRELGDLVHVHRLVTLTGVGGVGKTRLAVQVAADLAREFPDGVWLVELAPVGDSASVPDAVATALGVVPQAGMSVTASVAQALSGRRLLLVLDNCEHVLDSAADVVEAILARTATVQVIVTSREGLRVEAEQLWVVPSLDVGAGAASAAVQLFVDRARSVNAGFALDSEADANAVHEICDRLDGVALAIELAAARMVSMSPQDVRDRLGDRFRLLSGARRGLERHQTLRHVVGWSYDLLDEVECTVLNRCSAFAGGFDLAAAAYLNDGLDEYDVLDVLDSLVRKSLLTVGQVGGHSRYQLLETIRQFAEDQLAGTGSFDQVRDRHAAYFAAQAIDHWKLWDGPGYRVAMEWVESEFANLRGGFRWAADRSELATATAIAAHTAMIGLLQNVFEPIGWAEEILPAAATAEVEQLPRLYTAASLCGWVGRYEAGAVYAQTALDLADGARHDPFHPAWTRYMAGNAALLAGAGLDRFIDVLTGLAGESGLEHVIGVVQLVYRLPGVGRVEEARDMALRAVSAARAHGNPVYIGMALIGLGRAFADIDPIRAIDAFRQAEVVAQEHRIPFMVTVIARDAASLEAQYGDRNRGLELFDSAITSTHLAGNPLGLAAVLAGFAAFMDRAGQPETAATVYGTSTRYADASAWVMNLTSTIEHLRAVLGQTLFDELVAVGAAMRPDDAVAYARQQVRNTRSHLGGASS